MYGSFLCSCCYRSPGEFIGVREVAQGNFLCALGRIERKGVGRNLRLPILDAQRVLWRASHGLAGDDIFAWDRARAGLDPDLPIGVCVPKGQMLTFDAVDDALTDMRHLDDVRHHHLEWLENRRSAPGAAIPC